MLNFPSLDLDARRVMDVMVNLDNLTEFEPAIYQTMADQDFHPIQCRQIVKRNRELMEKGLDHPTALLQAAKEAGDPALECIIAWKNPNDFARGAGNVPG